MFSQIRSHIYYVSVFALHVYDQKDYTVIHGRAGRESERVRERERERREWKPILLLAAQSNIQVYALFDRIEYKSGVILQLTLGYF